MLDCARRITVQDGQVRGGAWAPINGMELFGKTVGIIGYGAIGKQLGRLTNGIGMTTYAYDPFMNEAYAKEHNVLTADIDFIVKNCDIVSVHVPYMESTKNIISRERIFSMKDGADPHQRCPAVVWSMRRRLRKRCKAASLRQRHSTRLSRSR